MPYNILTKSHVLGDSVTITEASARQYPLVLEKVFLMLALITMEALLMQLLKDRKKYKCIILYERKQFGNFSGIFKLDE